MKMMIKGGVWKNSEDEILKALVMKYGKNEWSRISSLLTRKSSKQLKARWLEWLDPSIKKTEWTREEDEKLLHLAKLMPSQWRTIAPAVGRTTTQCLERYERLVDVACARDCNYDVGDDPRKLQPGEIDSNAESRPARPDSIDMDEDEIEMISQARARLANTRGKKAKRKAREKQLDEARLLSELQKRRELKAAGIDRKRKRNGIVDYNDEIPFEKKPPLGFYNVADEIQQVEHAKFPTTVDEIQGEKRCYKEARLRRQDAARNSILHRPSAMLQLNKLNDPEAVRKRPKLNLPAPQIPDHELEHIAKFRLPEEFPGGSVATRALLVDYAQTPHQVETSLRTPLRTPASKHNAIMMEAENQARSRLSQTPLLGGENPVLHPSDFSGVTPKKIENQTPNFSGVAALTSRVGFTPSRDAASFGMTPKGTPIRDDLHINDDMDMSPKFVLQRHADLRSNLRSGLTSLPQPKYEYQIMVQPIPEDNEELEEKMEEDMSDMIARDKAGDEAKLQDLQKKWSEVLQRGLPRPSAASLQLLKNSLLTADKGKSSVVPPTVIEQADMMVRKELLSFLEHDNLKYPSGENVQEKMTALQDEFEIVRRRMDDETKKAQKFEQKIKVLTSGYQHRGRNLWSQIEATLKLVDDAEIELKCFQDLRNREKLSASRRVNTLWKEVQKQKELEQILQKRYGYVLLAQAGAQEEYAAKKCN
ncbi:Cell division cycle 5 [Heracleum sosnowskyi]|uniref:Cell division cycle 5 n=1 Tax=Heracleum sosnowskyi TaxID=360622 RepID=A0AAD8N090_9APIA|nr:Cell division cycle 5 [Heracleum sosnowskyi]